MLKRASSGLRRVIGIAEEGVVWMALCHWDCRGGRCVDGEQGVVWVALCRSVIEMP